MTSHDDTTAGATRAVGYPMWFSFWAALCSTAGFPLLAFWWYPPQPSSLPPRKQDGEPRTSSPIGGIRDSD